MHYDVSISRDKRGSPHKIVSITNLGLGFHHDLELWFQPRFIKNIVPTAIYQRIGSILTHQYVLSTTTYQKVVSTTTYQKIVSKTNSPQKHKKMKF
jgi:hypothetical protein